MDIYLIGADGSKFHFPVNPEEITIRREKQYETVNILRIGEVDFSQVSKIKEISFSSFFPHPNNYDASYCRYPRLMNPQHAMNRLNSMLISNSPRRLMITTTEVNILIMVSAHDTKFKGGEPGDVYFDLICRTYKEGRVRTASPATASNGGQTAKTTRSDTKPVPKVYTVKTGDNLTSIAKRQLGSSSKWRAIYDKNKKLIGKDPNKIKPGMKLVMP